MILSLAVGTTGQKRRKARRIPATSNDYSIRECRWNVSLPRPFSLLNCYILLRLNNIRVKGSRGIREMRVARVSLFRRRRNGPIVLFTSEYRVNRVSLLEWHGIFRFRASFFDRLFLSAIVNLSLPLSLSLLHVFIVRESSKANGLDSVTVYIHHHGIGII